MISFEGNLQMCVAVSWILRSVRIKQDHAQCLRRGALFHRTAAAVGSEDAPAVSLWKGKGWFQRAPGRVSVVSTGCKAVLCTALGQEGGWRRIRNPILSLNSKKNMNVIRPFCKINEVPGLTPDKLWSASSLPVFIYSSLTLYSH